MLDDSSVPSRPSVETMTRVALMDEVLILRQRVEALDGKESDGFKIAIQHMLSGKERQVFALLHHRLGSVVRKGAIMDWVYADQLDAPDAKIVDVFIHKIRRKLEDTQWRIETIWGVGYQLNGAPLLAAPISQE